MKKSKTIKVDDIYCDVCHKKNGDDFRRNCYICRKDLCLHCFISYPADPYGYNYVYCPECWKICEPFINRIWEEQDESDKKIDKIKDEMKKACTAANKKAEQ